MENFDSIYTVSKRMEIAGSHNLNLPYESKCANLHGHNWIVTVYCSSKNELTDYGMVVDFKHIKNVVQERLDHQYLNDIFDFNPTAENIARWICDEVNKNCEVGRCFKVTVRESEGNIATYERIYK